MSLFVKICGVTDERTVEVAAECGASAVGLVFAPSVRRVTPRRARELVAATPPDLQRVAVFLKPSVDDVRAVLDAVPIDAVQCDAESAAAIAAALECPVIPVVRDGAAMPQTIDAAAALADRILFEGATSGRGVLADWRTAAIAARRIPLILAGGLTPANVADAVAAVRPAGVDVSSGVESSPGRKDPARIRDFIAAARRAAAELHLCKEPTP